MVGGVLAVGLALQMYIALVFAQSSEQMAPTTRTCEFNLGNGRQTLGQYHVACADRRPGLTEGQV